MKAVIHRLDTLKPYPFKEKGFDLAKYIRTSIEINKDDYWLVANNMSKRTDVMTDGKRYYTIGQGGEGDSATYTLYVLDLPIQNNNPMLQTSKILEEIHDKKLYKQEVT